MTKHVVGRAADIAPGERRVVTLKGRPIVIFNLSGEYFGLLNRCPHQSADLSRGIATGIADSDEPGDAVCTRTGEFIRCPWHGWEFDIRTGQSWCDPSKIKVRPFTVRVEGGRTLAEGPYKAEAIPVSIDGEYLVVDA